MKSNPRNLLMANFIVSKSQPNQKINNSQINYFIFTYFFSYFSHFISIQKGYLRHLVKNATPKIVLKPRAP